MMHSLEQIQHTFFFHEMYELWYGKGTLVCFFKKDKKVKEVTNFSAAGKMCVYQELPNLLHASFLSDFKYVAVSHVCEFSS